MQVLYVHFKEHILQLKCTIKYILKCKFKCKMYTVCTSQGTYSKTKNKKICKHPRITVQLFQVLDHLQLDHA